jgi:DNA-directed RNA polymerase subunit RPC12/RpoP
MTESLDDNPIACPYCDHAFEPQEGAVQACPACGAQFFLQRESDEEEPDEDREMRELAERRVEDQANKLNDRHIRSAFLERQSINRARTWALVGAFLCLGAAGQLVWKAIPWFRTDDPTRGVAYLVIAFGAVGVGIHFFRKARACTREAESLKMPEPTDAPDFSSLSNGSQIVDELRKMTDDR